MAGQHISNMLVNHTDFWVGLVCSHKIVWYKDVKKEVIHKLLTARDKSDALLLSILVVVYNTSSV